MQHDMEHIPGVVSTEVGYTGGHVAHPTYEDVGTETTGHLESIEIAFDPAKITYAQLVERYWHLIDPTDAGGAFCDRGASYHSAIFVSTPEQRRIAEASKAYLEQGALKNRIVTPIRDVQSPSGRPRTITSTTQTRTPSSTASTAPAAARTASCAASGVRWPSAEIGDKLGTRTGSQAPGLLARP